MSIFHRFTGLGLALTAMLVVWWFMAAATSPEYFDLVDGLLTSWIGTLVMIVSLAALWYHFFNGTPAPGLGRRRGAGEVAQSGRAASRCWPRRG